MDSPYWPYVFILILIVLSAFFSGSEIAYASANRLRLKKAAESGRSKEHAAFYIYEHYEGALSTILIGNNLVNIAASSVATIIAVDLLGDSGAAVATLTMTVLILIFGEIAPKILAKENCDTFATAVALPLRFLMVLLKPVVALVLFLVGLVAKLWKDAGDEDSVTEEDLVSLIETVEDEGVIDEDRSELLQSALEFSDISAQEILTPRVDMIAIDIDDPYDVILETAESSPYSRIPVYENTIDNVIGVLYLNHFFKKAVEGSNFSIRSLLMEVCFIHKSMKLPAVLAELKRRKTHMAIVTDEYGGTMGLLTMEDVLEQLVGEIWDETDVIVNECTDLGDGLYEVSGDMSLSDFLDEVEVKPGEELEDDYTTVGGWAIERLQKFPQPGDSFTYENMTVTVTEVDDLRVLKLTVKVDPKEEDESDF